MSWRRKQFDNKTRKQKSQEISDKDFVDEDLEDENYRKFLDYKGSYAENFEDDA